MKKTLNIFTFLVTFLFCVNISSAQAALTMHMGVVNSSDVLSDWVSSDYPSSMCISEMVPDQTTYLAVIVTDYGFDASSQTDLTADVTIKNPDGTIKFQEDNYLYYSHEVGTELFVLLEDPLGIVFDHTDQKGVYVITVTLRDNILNETTSGQYSITLQ